MQVELTRKNTRNHIGSKLDGRSTTSNEITLNLTGLNRGESEFLYESLMGFLNNADKKMERYFVRRDLAALQKDVDSPERAILAELLIRVGKSTRISEQDKRAINGMVSDLKKIFEELR